MFEVVNGETIRASGSRVATVPNGLGNKGRGEGGDGCVKGVSLIKAPLDKSGTGIGGVGGDGGELFVEGCGYCKRAGVGHGVERDGLVGWGGGVAS